MSHAAEKRASHDRARCAIAPTRDVQDNAPEPRSCAILERSAQTERNP